MAFAPAVWLAVRNELCGEDRTEFMPANCSDDFEDYYLFNRFHLSRPCINFITDYVSLHLTKAMPDKMTCHSPGGMVMAALDYYANGLVSTTVQDKVGLNPLETPEIISVVSKVLSGMVNDFVTFPRTRDSRANVANDFKNFCRIPNVLGVVACMHVKVRPSQEEKEVFRNSLSLCSVMTQVICDCEGNLLSVEDCRVGGTSEQSIWKTSVIGSQFMRGTHGANYIIGGMSHVLGSHLLTAVSTVTSESELRFNSAHRKVFQVMQETLSCLKSRFRCLQYLGFAQKDSLEKKADIINACCVLHNIAKKFSVVSLFSSGVKLEPTHPGAFYPLQPGEVPYEAIKARDDLIASYFSVASSDLNP